MGENIPRRRSGRPQELNLQKNEENVIDINHEEFNNTLDHQEEYSSLRKTTGGKKRGIKRKLLNEESTMGLFANDNQEAQPRILESLKLPSKKGSRKGKKAERFEQSRRAYKPQVESIFQLSTINQSQLVAVNNEFSFRESLMKFVRAGGPLGDAIAQRYYKQNLTRALEKKNLKQWQQQKQQQKAMVLIQRQQELSLPVVNPVQKTEHQQILQQPQKQHVQQNPQHPLAILMQKKQRIDQQKQQSLEVILHQKQQQQQHQVFQPIPQWNPFKVQHEPIVITPPVHLTRFSQSSIFTNHYIQDPTFPGMTNHYQVTASSSNTSASIENLYCCGLHRPANRYSLNSSLSPSASASEHLGLVNGHPSVTGRFSIAQLAPQQKIHDRMTSGCPEWFHQAMDTSTMTSLGSTSTAAPDMVDLFEENLTNF